VTNKEGDTCLHLICENPMSTTSASRADVVIFLMTSLSSFTVDMNIRDSRGHTPLHIAARQGDLALVQVVLEHAADPNCKEGTTGWSPLHIAVAKAHHPVVLQLLQQDSIAVDQVDNFEWTAAFEAACQLDARCCSYLANAGSSLDFRDRNGFDMLAAVDSSPKDLASKRWISCLLVSNGFDYEKTKLQISDEDRLVLEKERVQFLRRTVPLGAPPFHVPDHLAPRCTQCKMVFSVTVRRLRCLCCGLVLCRGCILDVQTQLCCVHEKRARQAPTPQPPPGPPSRPPEPTPDSDDEDLVLLDEFPPALAGGTNGIQKPPASLARTMSAEIDRAVPLSDRPEGVATLVNPPRTMVRAGDRSSLVDVPQTRTVTLCSVCRDFFDQGLADTYSAPMPAKSIGFGGCS